MDTADRTASPLGRVLRPHAECTLGIKIERSARLEVGHGEAVLTEDGLWHVAIDAHDECRAAQTWLERSGCAVYAERAALSLPFSVWVGQPARQGHQARRVVDATCARFETPPGDGRRAYPDRWPQHNDLNRVDGWEVLLTILSLIPFLANITH